MTRNNATALIINLLLANFSSTYQKTNKPAKIAKSKKQRRLAAKNAKAALALDPAPKVPLERQSVDLYAGDGSLEGGLRAVGVREELRGAMRAERRKGIKEANFLRGMR